MISEVSSQTFMILYAVSSLKASNVAEITRNKQHPQNSSWQHHICDGFLSKIGFKGEGAREQKAGQSEGWNLQNCWASLRWSHCGFGPQLSAADLKISWAILDFMEKAQVWSRLRARGVFLGILADL